MSLSNDSLVRTGMSPADALEGSPLSPEEAVTESLLGVDVASASAADAVVAAGGADAPGGFAAMARRRGRRQQKLLKCLEAQLQIRIGGRDGGLAGV